jgi:hypothetical protein
MKFRLDIYTWPACSGIDVEMITKIFDSAQEAYEFAQNVDKDTYAYASLQRSTDIGFAPCRWDGRFCIPSEKWPVIFGNHKDHPVIADLKLHESDIIAEIRQRYDAGEKIGGMIEIAGKIIRERYPQTSGWSKRLARKAADRSGEFSR